MLLRHIVIIYDSNLSQFFHPGRIMLPRGREILPPKRPVATLSDNYNNDTELIPRVSVEYLKRSGCAIVGREEKSPDYSVFKVERKINVLKSVWE